MNSYILMLLLPLFALGSERAYVIRNGDTLSQIAQRELGEPVYGRSGSLAELRKRNPWAANAASIHPGQTLLLEGLKLAAEETPSRKPAAESAPSAEEFAPRSQIELSAGGSYFRIDAVDRANNSSAMILSKFSPAVSASWRLRFTESYASLLGLRLRKHSIEPNTGMNKRIDGDGTAVSFHAGAERNEGGGRTRVLLGQEASLYVAAQSPQAIQLIRVPVPYFSLEHAQEVFRRQTAAAGIGAKIGAFAPASHASFRAKAGYEGKLFLFLAHERATAPLRGELSYSKRKADSSIVKQNMSELGISLSIALGD